MEKQLNEEGNYIGQDGLRYEILHCERTESKEYYETGETDEEGNPVLASRIAINKGWNEFADEQTAAEAYGLSHQSAEGV